MVPLTLPPARMTNASLVASCPVRFSKPEKPVSSTLPALAPVIDQTVWSKLGKGPTRVSLALLPTRWLIRANGAPSAVAAPVWRFTVTAAPRVE